MEAQAGETDQPRRGWAVQATQAAGLHGRTTDLTLDSCRVRGQAVGSEWRKSVKSQGHSWDPSRQAEKPGGELRQECRGCGGRNGPPTPTPGSAWPCRSWCVCLRGSEPKAVTSRFCSTSRPPQRSSSPLPVTSEELPKACEPQACSDVPASAPRTLHGNVASQVFQTVLYPISSRHL